MFKKTLFSILVSLMMFSSVSMASNPVNNNSQPPSNEVPADNIDSTSFGFDLGIITHQGITGSTRQSWIRRGINYFFERVIGFMAGIIGTLSILVMSYGGLLMIFSAGNEELYQKGTGLAKYALLGLVFTLSAYILVNLVQLLVKSIYG